MKQGFTLIELLIAIGIIALLVAGGTYSWTNAQSKARDNRRKQDLKEVQKALELYFQTNGRYPPYRPSGGCWWWDSTNVDCIGWCQSISNTDPNNPQVKQDLVPNYLRDVPSDPAYPAGTPGDYLYRKVSRDQYRLVSVLENTKDPDYVINFEECWGLGNYYNYKVTNP